MLKAFNWISYIECMYSRFWAGNDGVPRPSGTEPVKGRGKNQQYTVHIHMQHISMFTLTMVSRCLRHLIEYRESMYSRFWAGDDGVLRPSGTEPVKERRKNQQYTVHIHMQHISMFPSTMVSRCLRHLFEISI